jgi:uncharacterized protein (DUF302 family)
MLLEIESKKTVQEIGKSFPEVCAKYKFGVMGSYNLRQKLNEKGVPFDRDCLVFEVCNPQQAGKVLEANISIATVLPCRIAVYQEGEKTKIAAIKPTALLGLFPNPEIKPVAEEVERIFLLIMHELA